MKEIEMNETEQLKKNIVKTLTTARKINNLSQAEVALKADMDSSHYWSIENGRILPSLKVLVRISEVLGISIDQMLIRDNDNLEYTIAKKSIDKLNKNNLNLIINLINDMIKNQN